MKLSAQQNKTLYALQKGYSLITSADYKGATVAGPKGHFYISNTVFWNLHEKGFIHQQLSWPFYYTITESGINAKTRKVPLP